MAADVPPTVDYYSGDKGMGFPPGFLARRGLNWAFLGLLYTSYYMCRYNMSIANKTISDEKHFTRGDMGWILSTTALAYAIGQIINGMLTDRIGGRRAMVTGAIGTIVANLAFGTASFSSNLWLFVAIWGVNGYVQSLGAPGMVKINAAWFAKQERGRFAGIFGFMINLGRFGIFQLGPALLAGFGVFGMFYIGPLHWRWLFWAPSIICGIVAIFVWIVVKETPEECGYQAPERYVRGAFSWNAFAARFLILAAALLGGFGLWWIGLGAILIPLLVLTIVITLIVLYLVSKQREPARGEARSHETEKGLTRAEMGAMLKAISRNPAIWITALAYACTGAVRSAIDNWFPRYMEEVHLLKLDDVKFQWLGFLIPFVASVGSLTSGYVSDLFFKSRRAPVAAALYVIETIIILSAAQFTTVGAVILFFVLISFTANSTHSLLGTAAAMDIGGRKGSGFSSGVIDSFQYFGSTLAGFLLGKLIDHAGWETYFYFMAPFGVLGCLLMVLMGSGAVTTIERARPKQAKLIAGSLVTLGLGVIVTSAVLGLSAYYYGQTHMAESLGRSLLASKVQEKSQRCLRIVSFETHDISPAPGGEYEMAYNATLRCEKECMWGGKAENGWNFDAKKVEAGTAATLPAATAAATASASAPAEGVLSAHANKGEEVKISGVIRYQHTPDGWQIKEAGKK